MRITTTMLGQSALSGIRSAQQRLVKLEAQIAAESRVTVPSDDPAATTRALQARHALRAQAQWQRNLDRVGEFVATTDTALTQLADLVTEFETLATKAADDAVGSTGRQAIATQLDQLLEAILSEANGAHGGVQLFGGSRTDAVPCVAIRDAEGALVAVQAPSGEANDQEAVRRLVGENVLLTINTAPSDLFGEQREFFADLIALRDAVRGGDGDGVRELLPRVAVQLERVAQAQSVCGALQNRIASRQAWLERQDVDQEAVRATQEDLDVTTAMVDLRQEQAVLETALSAAERLLDLSLTRFQQ